MITALEIILIVIVAVGISILGNIGGFGGGVFLVPLLISVFSYESDIVAGTVLLAMIFPTTVGTALAWKKDEVDWKFGLLMGIPSSAGALAASFAASAISDSIAVYIISSLALILSIRMLIFTIQNGKKKSEDENTDKNPKKTDKILFNISRIKPVMRIEHKGFVYDISTSLVFLFGILFGILSGLFGISGGWLQTPLMIVFFGLSPLIASGTSLFVILIKATVGGVTHIFLGNIDWILFLILALSMPIGAVIGNYFKGKMKGKQVSLIIGVVLLLVTIFTMVFFFI